MIWPWRRMRHYWQMLSDYLDDELPPERVGRVEEGIVLDARSQQRLDGYLRVTELVHAATSPVDLPDADAFIDTVEARLAALPDESEAGTVSPPRPPPASRFPRNRLATGAVVASIGLLVTGVTLVGLRRRGIV